MIDLLKVKLAVLDRIAEAVRINPYCWTCNVGNPVAYAAFIPEYNIAVQAILNSGATHCATINNVLNLVYDYDIATRHIKTYKLALIERVRKQVIATKGGKPFADYLIPYAKKLIN